MEVQYKRLINIIATMILLLIEILLFAFFWYTFFSVRGDVTFVLFKGKGNIAIIGIYILFMYFFTRTLGGYKVGYLKISDVCISQVIAIICTNVVEYAELCIVLHAWVSVVHILFLSILEIFVSLIWSYVFRKIYIQLYPPHNMLFIYGEKVQNELVQKISLRGDKYNIKSTISIKEGLDKIFSIIPMFESVIVGDISAKSRNDIIKYCYEKNVRTYITPKVSDIIIMNAEELNLFDTPLLLARNNGITGEKLFVKRLMDIIISSILLLMLFPFMVITAICIKCYDGGPIFYKQERLTRNRVPFMILKFRSMKIDSEKDGARLSSKDDDRVTPVGKIIRRLHFDEIPQLINILKGEMSFVGPRPEREVIAREYEEKIPEFSYRLKVKAGLTGYAQVYGKYNTTPYDKMKLDLMYIENYSLLLDIKIILMTIKVIFQKENSEGVNNNQKTALEED